jgi:hypothetical protein
MPDYFNVLDNDSTPLVWTAPTLLNGWVLYATGGIPEFAKDDQGVVYLRGMMNSGDRDVDAFVLPAGYRPSEWLIFSGSPRIDILESGALVVKGTGSGWISLSRLSFVAA